MSDRNANGFQATHQAERQKSNHGKMNGGDNERLFCTCLQMIDSGQYQINTEFAWVAPHDLTFVPKTGHIRIGHAKTISARYVTDRPMKLLTFMITWKIEKIDSREVCVKAIIGSASTAFVRGGRDLRSNRRRKWW
jgi:hypothetical protein